MRHHRRVERRGYNPTSALAAAVALAAVALVVYDGTTSLRHTPSLPAVEALKLSSLGSLSNGGGSGHRSTSDAESTTTSEATNIEDGSYGVDRSFPAHHASVKTDGDSKEGVYDDFMLGCYSTLSPQWQHLCDESEAARMGSNLRQPPLMRNYTNTGFKKVRAPKLLMKALLEFSSANDVDDVKTTANEHELWNRGSTHVNHWSSPTRMINIGDSSRAGGGGEPLRTTVWNAARDALERWTGLGGELLSPSSLYGMRVFQEGAVMPPHVDRMPFVLSAVINVAQDLDEPWPLEVYGHDGVAYNVTMNVGDMLLYEGHSVLHGRPFPMKGKHYADIFVHFEPLGHALRHEERMILDEATEEESLEYLYQQVLSGAMAEVGKESIASDIDFPRAPRYIMEGSLEEARWTQTHPRTKMRANTKSSAKRAITAHTAASIGDLDALREIDVRDPSAILRVDENGWTPLHEAVRGGYTEVVDYLIARGLDINARTHDGKGGSPLWWAKQVHGKNHQMVRYLKQKGAENIKPEN